LAERDPNAHPVEDRPAARRQRHLLAVLRLPEPRERLRPDSLQPGGAQEETAEADDQDSEEEPDPPVDETAHAGLLPAEVHVRRLLGGRRDEAEPFDRERLDPAGSGRTRKL